MLIGILGKKYHGKDTAADYIVKHYQFTKMAFATPLKNICKELFDFNEQQLYGDQKEEFDPYWQVTPRVTFQYIGTDLLREQMYKILPQVGNHIWVKSLENKLNKLPPHLDIVVSDVRFDNEAAMIKSRGGIIIKLKRKIESKDNHSSESHIDDIPYDYLIDNNSTFEYLYSCIDKILQPMILTKQIDNLYKLDMSFKKLHHVPSLIFNLTHLRHLHLHNNKISNIPKEIGNMVNLQSLHIYYNELTAIPKEIGKLTQLKVLNLSLNSINVVPEELCKLTNLHTLNLSYNKIKYLPYDMILLTKLKSYDYSHNPVVTDCTNT
jgi:hypothetical protein